MKSSVIFLSFLLAGMFLITSVMADPQIQVSSLVNPTPVAPGTDGYVQLTFMNTGTSAASNIQVTGISADPNLKISTSGVNNLGSLANGQSTTGLFKFSVSGSAPSGLYTIRFAINICTSSCNEIDPTVVVTVQSPSSLQVTSIQPDTLNAGETSTLNFNLFNEGNDAINNIILTWSTPNNEILPLGLSNRQFISSLEGGTSLTIPVNVSASSSISPGVIPLTIQLTYHDKSGILQNITSTIGIKIGGTTDFDVAVQQVSAGTVSLSIANIGVNPATSVAVSIPQQNNFVVSGTTSSFLGTLNSGDFSVASFTISSRFSRTSNETSATNNMLSVEISYSDTSGARQVIQKEVSLQASSLQSGTTTRNRSFGFVEILEIVIVIIIVTVLLWYLEFRKKKHTLSNFIRRRRGKT